ncbi:polymer-forming cytoskeletal protein [bacterium]|nr:polymer-forming cytoskeletal protein [candidate division CSSED10-310 bacterium]
MSDFNTPTKKGSSFLADKLIIHGNISGDGDMRLSGNVHGEINLKTGSLIVEKNGYVEGDINVRDVTVAGWVKGKIVTSERVEIADSGRVEGSIVTPNLKITQGAIISGDFNVSKAK